MPYIKPLVDHPFAAARLSSPQTLTLAELELIFRRLHVDKDEAITAIQKGIKT